MGEETTRIHDEIEALRQMSTAQLKAKYREVFGEETRSNHKQFLFRRIAWRIQANAWGGLSQRVRQPSGYTSSAEQYMPPEALAEVVNALTPEEQAAVREFIDFLKRGTGYAQSPFLVAINEFMDQHPELLRRLAQ